MIKNIAHAIFEAETRLRERLRQENFVLPDQPKPRVPIADRSKKALRQNRGRGRRRKSKNQRESR